MYGALAADIAAAFAESKWYCSAVTTLVRQHVYSKARDIDYCPHRTTV